MLPLKGSLSFFSRLPLPRLDRVCLLPTHSSRHAYLSKWHPHPLSCSDQDLGILPPLFLSHLISNLSANSIGSTLKIFPDYSLTVPLLTPLNQAFIISHLQHGSGLQFGFPASAFDLFSSMTYFQCRSQNDPSKHESRHSSLPVSLGGSWTPYDGLLGSPRPGLPAASPIASPPVRPCPFCPSLHWSCSPNMRGIFLMWGLCVCGFLCLEHSFYQLLHGSLSPFFRFCSNTTSSERLSLTIVTKILPLAALYLLDLLDYFSQNLALNDIKLHCQFSYLLTCFMPAS